MTEIVAIPVTEVISVSKEISKESSSMFSLSRIGPRDVLFFSLGVSIGWGLKHLRNKYVFIENSWYLETKRRWLVRSLEKTNEGLGKSAKDIS